MSQNAQTPDGFAQGSLLPRIMGILVALFLCLVVLVFTSPDVEALNYFDPPKRCVWGCLALLLALYSTAGRERAWNMVSVLAVLLGCWMVARTLVRPHPFVELSVLFVWLLPVVLFLVGQQVAMRWRRGIGGTMGVLIVVQLVIMLLQYAGRDPFFSDTTDGMRWSSERMLGTIGYHNQAAEFLGLGSAVFLLASGGRVFGLLGSVLSLAGIGLTACRTALLAACTGLCLSWPLVSISAVADRRGRRWVLLGLVATAAAVVAVCTPHSRERWMSLLEKGTNAPGIASRYLLARAAVDMVSERPWTGWGAGEYAYQYLERIGAVRVAVDPVTASAVVYAREAHNDWLQFLAEFGAVGLLLAIALFWHVLLAASRGRLADPCRFGVIVHIVSFMAVAALGAFVWQTAVTGPAAGFLLGWLTPATSAGDQRVGVRLGRLVGALVRFCTTVAATLVFVWFAGEMLWNKQIADGFSDGLIAQLVPATPRWAYRTHGILGSVLARDGKYVQAESELRHALEGFREPTLYNNLGHVLVAQGKWSEAEAVYRRWADSGIDEATALMNLATAYENQGRIRDAADTLQQRDRIVVTSSVAEVQRLASLLLKAGDAENALIRIRLCERQSGGVGSLSPELENLAGAADMMIKDYSNAVVRFEAALRKKPNMESARRNLENARAFLRQAPSP